MRRLFLEIAEKILKGILSISSIILLIFIYLIFDNLIKNKYERDFESKALDIISSNKIKFSTKEEFENFKKELEYFLLKGFKIYNSNSIFNDNPKENFCVITEDGIVGFRVYVNDQSIEFINGKIIGSKGLELIVPKSIRIFDLSHNILAWFSISGFKKLEKLNLRDCRLGSIELGDLPSLKEIDFSWNEPLEKISISGLQSLEKIYINSTLKEIVLSNLQSLRSIDFSDYSLERVEFSNMPLLEQINLKGSKLAYINFYNLPSIKEINLSKNKGIRHFYIKDLGKVVTLKISQTNIDDSVLAYIILNLPSIQELDLSYNNNLKNIDLSQLHYLNKLNISGSFYIDKVILSKTVKDKIKINGMNNQIILMFK